MLTTVVVLLRSIGLICGGHRAVVLENLALRQQLATLTRARQRPQLRARDRLFWVALERAWRGWRTALVVVHPDTVRRSNLATSNICLTCVFMDCSRTISISPLRRAFSGQAETASARRFSLGGRRTGLR